MGTIMAPSTAQEATILPHTSPGLIKAGRPKTKANAIPVASKVSGTSNARRSSTAANHAAAPPRLAPANHPTPSTAFASQPLASAPIGTSVTTDAMNLSVSITPNAQRAQSQGQASMVSKQVTVPKLYLPYARTHPHSRSLVAQLLHTLPSLFNGTLSVSYMIHPTIRRRTPRFAVTRLQCGCFLVFKPPALSAYDTLLILQTRTEAYLRRDLASKEPSTPRALYILLEPLSISCHTATSHHLTCLPTAPDTCPATPVDLICHRASSSPSPRF